MKNYKDYLVIFSSSN